MKNLIFRLMLLPISLLAACGNKAQTIDFIPGTYVNHAQSAYSIADDTLVIIPDALTQTNYHIIRKTGFRRIKDSKLRPVEHRVKSFTGLWDEQKQTMQITQNGVLLLFHPDQNKLLIQNSEYRKL
jgi:major membrane immunogen (membrane-anchored lipoprotein)